MPSTRRGSIESQGFTSMVQELEMSSRFYNFIYLNNILFESFLRKTVMVKTILTNSLKDDMVRKVTAEIMRSK